MIDHGRGFLGIGLLFMALQPQGAATQEVPAKAMPSPACQRLMQQHGAGICVGDRLQQQYQNNKFIYYYADGTSSVISGKPGQSQSAVSSEARYPGLAAKSEAAAPAPAAEADPSDPAENDPDDEGEPQ